MKWISIGMLLVSSVSFASKTSENTEKFESLRKPSEKVQLAHIPWTNPRVELLVNKFLSSYTQLFIEFQRAFAPYDLKLEINDEDLWTHLCASRLAKICEEPEFRNHLAVIYAKKITESSKNKDLSGNEQFFVNWQKLHSSVEHLKPLFSEFHSQYLKELENLVSESSHLESLASLNAALDNVRKRTESSATNYTQKYAQASSSYPGRLLQSKVFLNVVEGLHYKVEKIDIILAMEASTKVLQENFAFDLISILASYSKENRQNYVREWKDDLDILQERSLGLEAYSKWDDDAPYEAGPMASGSEVHIPKITNEKVLELLREFHNHDGATINFLLRNSFQRAAWQLRDNGQNTLGDKLEAFIEADLFNPKNLVSIKPLGGGAATTYVAIFKDKLRCVYKAAGFDIEHPIEIFFTSSSHEIAASVMDRLIDLRMVPLTVNKKIDKFQSGSCQYFAENTIQAREMMQYDGTKPTKFQSPSGRATKPNDVLFFDWLIDNLDRNVDNYLFANDGRLVLIDHGFTFKFLLPHPLLLTWKDVKNMVPSERIYHRLVKLDKNPRVLREALKPWLSSNHIWIISTKIHNVVKILKKHKVYTQKSLDSFEL